MSSSPEPSTNADGLRLVDDRLFHIADRVGSFVQDFWERRSSAPATSGGLSEDLARRLAAHPPREGVAVEDALAVLAEALDPGFDTAGGGFLSFIPSGALPVGALGAYAAVATNRYTGANHAAPGMVAVEQSVVDWMRNLFGLPDDGGGVLTSGGSIANFTATLAARTWFDDRRGRADDERRWYEDGVVYAAAGAHHSVAKAARMAGVRADHIREIPTDAGLRMDVTELATAVETDRSEGLEPMLIVATAGTTDTGAVDPIGDIADVAASAGAWLHVDAAYGGFFQLTRRGRDLLTGIGRADSITVDAHKSLFLPFGVGAVLVADRRRLIAAHGGTGAYMQDLTNDSLPQYFAMSPELTRPNRGLMAWLPLQVHGTDAFRFELDRMLDLAERAATSLDEIEGIAVVTRGPLSIVTFNAEGGDDDTRMLFDRLNRSGVTHVSSTTIDDRFVIRLAFLSQRTDARRVDDVVALIRSWATAGDPTPQPR